MTQTLPRPSVPGLTRRAALTFGLGDALGAVEINEVGGSERHLDGPEITDSGGYVSYGPGEAVEVGTPAALAMTIARESVNRTHDGGAVLAPRPGWMVRLTTSSLTCVAMLVPVQLPRIGGWSVYERPLEVAPRVAEQAEAVRWLRNAGMTLQQLERVLGVTRQTIHNWSRELRIERLHLERLLAVRDVMERARRRYAMPEDLAAWLVRPRGVDAVTPLAAMESEDFDRARYLAISSPSPRVRPIVSLRDRADVPVLPGMRAARPEAERLDLDEALAALHSDDGDGEDG